MILAKEIKVFIKGDTSWIKLEEFVVWIERMENEPS